MPLMAFLLQCTPALCCFSVMLHSPLNPPLLLTYLYQLLNFRVFFFTIYCCQSVPCTAEIVCCAVYRLFSQILDAGTTASRRRRFFHCQRKVHALLICCKEHLTADSCLLWYRLRMASQTKSTGMDFTTKQTSMADQKGKDYFTPSNVETERPQLKNSVLCIENVKSKCSVKTLRSFLAALASS